MELTFPSPVFNYTMKPRIASLNALSRVATCPRALPVSAISRTTPGLRLQTPIRATHLQLRCFTLGGARFKVSTPESNKSHDYDNSNARPAGDLNQNITQEEKDDYQKRLERNMKNKQIRTPWHHEGSDTPPVARQRSAGAMTKGMRLYTSPESSGSALMRKLHRQTSNHTLPNAQTHPPPYHQRHQLRPQRHRAFSPPCPPTTTPFLPRAPHPSRAPHSEDRRWQRAYTGCLLPCRGLYAG